MFLLSLFLDNNSWLFTFALQGTGRYSVYVANYARGTVGPHVLLEMDEAASDVSGGTVALSDVAAKAGVNKLTGQLVWDVRRPL